MGQYVVIIVTNVEAETDDIAILKAEHSVCQDGGGAWLCKELTYEKEPEQ